MEEKKLNQNLFDNNSLRITVTNVIHELGVPANIYGYFYLREAIILKANDPDITISVTRTLYPHIAAMFHTSTSQVERAIRHAIKISWARGSLIFHHELFGYVDSHSKRKPTTSKYITIITLYCQNYQ